MDRDAALFHLNESLFRIRRAQSTRRAARLHARLSGDWLSPTALSILADLESSGATRVKALAGRIQADVSRTSRQVHDLARRGYVGVVPDEADGRAVVVSLTDLGAEQWRAYHAEVQRVLATNLADWSDADVMELAELFDRLLLTLGTSPEDVPPAP